MTKSLTIKEAAEQLGVSIPKLLEITVKGKIKKIRGKRGEPFKYDPEVVKAYADSVADNKKEEQPVAEDKPFAEGKPKKAVEGPVTARKPKVAVTTPEKPKKAVSVAKIAKKRDGGLLTTREAAEYLGIARSTVAQAMGRGRIVPSVRSTSTGSSNMFSKEALDKYKETSDTFKKATKIAYRESLKWTFDGGKTAIKLVKYAEAHGHETAWQAIKALLDAIEKAAE